MAEALLDFVNLQPRSAKQGIRSAWMEFLELDCKRNEVYAPGFYDFFGKDYADLETKTGDRTGYVTCNLRRAVLRRHWRVSV